ncbi:MAG: nicotinate phosphoribosyltransferase [Desulfovermiculus sp.]|nr:nicotinate phosphoribosyltransferase [Desulfovermiculus sp.]
MSHREGFLPHCPTIALFTDLYELTMLQAYWASSMHQEAVFSLFTRKLPLERNFLLACGLDDALSYLEDLHFPQQALDYLHEQEIFQEDFLHWLSEFRFEGHVYALPEGTASFANEPLLEVVAPIGQAQLLETYLINQLHVQTMAASKAARIVLAAEGKRVIDFGLRRIHGIDAGLKAARSFYIAGVQATSNVLGGATYGVPISGTMAHSFIQAHDNELEAFRNFARAFPQTVLLVDTFDSLQGTRKVIKLAQELGTDFQIRGIRIDSSDLQALSFDLRKELDQAGLNGVSIFASGSLDEKVIQDMVASGAPIEGFGVGTKMGVSNDAPYLDMVYKLASYAGKGRLKTSTNKATLPYQKQVFRQEKENEYIEDILAAFSENHPGRPLMRQVMHKGERLPAGRESLAEIKDRAQNELAALPPALRGLEPAPQAYPVQTSSYLEQEAARIRAELLDTNNS